MSGSTACLSVVIPAHNEQDVIARTLDRLLDGAEPGELDVVVACNGCTDGTADIVARYGPRVRLVEVARASKAAALNAGDRAAIAFPRVFLDADIEVDVGTLRAVALALERGEQLAAAPAPHFDTRGCSWSVRAYYEVWSQLPYVADGLLGTGFYAVSRKGRARFDTFPDLVADDLFVQRLFRPHERAVVEGTFRVRPPRDVASLLRSKVRVYAGNRQYAEAVATGTVSAAVASSPHDAGTAGTAGTFRDLARQPAWWPRMITYAAIVITAKTRAAVRVRRGETTRWDKDATGRGAEP